MRNLNQVGTSTPHPTTNVVGLPMVTLGQPLPQIGEQLKISVDVAAEFNVSAEEAQRKANSYVEYHISNFLLCREPSLFVQDRIYWRMPIHLTLPSYGDIGVAGVLDLDVETGEIVITDTEIEEIKKAAGKLATTNVTITEKEAKRIVNRWLRNEVSMMFMPETPKMVLKDDLSNGQEAHVEGDDVQTYRVVWQVAVSLGSTHVGRVGLAGEVCVDAQSGIMYDVSTQKEKILQKGKMLAQKKPPYQHGVNINATPTTIHIKPRHSSGYPEGDLYEILATLGHSDQGVL
ncbi:MAG: hypothetical protein AAF639_21455 [Chloroflexota bacterium]